MLLHRITEDTGLLRKTRWEGEALSEDRLAYADLGYSGNKKIKFASVEAGEAMAAAAVQAFKKHLVSLGVKPAQAKKLAAHNARLIGHALSMVQYEDL